MSAIAFDKEKILEELRKTDYKEIVASFQKLKEDWDWNPFDKDGDEYETAWGELKHNMELLFNLLERVAITVEKVAVTTLGIASGGAKLEAAVKYLDEVVKLPFYIEFFDQHVFKLLLSLVVARLNDKYGHDWKSADLLK